MCGPPISTEIPVATSCSNLNLTLESELCFHKCHVHADKAAIIPESAPAIAVAGLAGTDSTSDGPASQPTRVVDTTPSAVHMAGSRSCLFCVVFSSLIGWGFSKNQATTKATGGAERSSSGNRRAELRTRPRRGGGLPAAPCSPPFAALRQLNLMGVTCP